MIPGTKVPITDDGRWGLKSLTTYLVDQLDEALSSEHEDLESRLDEWQRCYDGDPKQMRRNFPWPGAANIEVPIIGIHTDSIVARVVNTIFSMDPLWSVRPLYREVDMIAKPLEQYIDWSRKAEWNFYREIRPWTIEVVKFGWGWLKWMWEVYHQVNYVTGPFGEVIRQVEVVRRPAVYHVLARDVIKQAGVERVQDAEWVCHRLRLTDSRLRMRGIEGVYEDVEEIIKKKEDDSRQQEARASSKSAGRTKQSVLNTLYEFQVDWPYGPEENPPVVPMMATLHRESKQIKRLVFHPYGERTLVQAKFLEREGRHEGFGIARRLFQMQEEIGTLHRQQVDNSTLANTRFFVGRKNLLRGDTRIWPGRYISANDPDRDLKAYQLGDIYPSEGILESRALSYAERASGVSDYQLGRESQQAGSRATATATMALIQEGNRRFDLNVRDIRDVLSEIGRKVVLLNQMFRPQGAAFFVQGQDGMYTEAALRLPAQFSVTKIAVELTASTATINKEIEKQGLIGLYGIASQYYEQLAQTMTLLMNPEVPGDMKEMMVKTLNGRKYLMDRIVQTFDIKAIDDVVPGIAAPKQPPNIGGIAGSPDGSSAVSGMADVSAIHEGALRGRGNGAPEMPKLG